MNFDNMKKQALQKLDKSKKGSIDEQIKDLINTINKHPDYFTTSSCAGRILLLYPAEKKHLTKWLFSSHDPITLSQLEPFLIKLPKEMIWLRMEPPIIHICTRTLEQAKKLMSKANEAGFRRSSLLSFRNIVEIMIPEKMDVPISEKNKLLVSKDYLKILIREANNKLKKSQKKIIKIITFLR